jgi:hypothetical protein
MVELSGLFKWLRGRGAAVSSTIRPPEPNPGTTPESNGTGDQPPDDPGPASNPVAAEHPADPLALPTTDLSNAADVREHTDGLTGQDRVSTDLADAGQIPLGAAAEEDSVSPESAAPEERLADEPRPTQAIQPPGDMYDFLSEFIVTPIDPNLETDISGREIVEGQDLEQIGQAKLHQFTRFDGFPRSDHRIVEFEISHSLLQTLVHVSSLVFTTDNAQNERAVKLTVAGEALRIRCTDAGEVVECAAPLRGPAEAAPAERPASFVVLHRDLAAASKGASTYMTFRADLGKDLLWVSSGTFERPIRIRHPSHFVDITAERVGPLEHVVPVQREAKFLSLALTYIGQFLPTDQLRLDRQHITIAHGQARGGQDNAIVVFESDHLQQIDLTLRPKVAPVLAAALKTMGEFRFVTNGRYYFFECDWMAFGGHPGTHAFRDTTPFEKRAVADTLRIPRFELARCAIGVMRSAHPDEEEPPMGRLQIRAGGPVVQCSLISSGRVKRRVRADFEARRTNAIESRVDAVLALRPLRQAAVGPFVNEPSSHLEVALDQQQHLLTVRDEGEGFRVRTFLHLVPRTSRKRRASS